MTRFNNFVLCIFIITYLVDASCNDTRSKLDKKVITSDSINLNDSSAERITNSLQDILQDNANTDDTTISGHFERQWQNQDGEQLISLKIGDTTITLINLTPLKEDEIRNLKKDGPNITVTYRTLDKKVTLLIANYN